MQFMCIYNAPHIIFNFILINFCQHLKWSRSINMEFIVLAIGTNLVARLSDNDLAITKAIVN